MLQHFQWGRKSLALPTNWPAECCIWPIGRKVWAPALLVFSDRALRWLTISPSRSVTRYQHSARELYSLWCPAKDSLPGGVIILLVALCYRIRNKLRQQTCVLWSENWSKTPASCFSITPEHGYLPCIIFNRTNTRSRTWPRKRWAPSDVG